MTYHNLAGNRFTRTSRRPLAGNLMQQRQRRPGTHGGVSLKPAPVFSSVTQQYRAAGTTALSLTPPAIPDGALMMMAVFIQSDTDTISDVSGTTGAWTKVDGPSPTSNAGAFEGYLFMKDALGESGDYTCTKTGTTGSSLMVLVVYTGADGVPTADFQKDVALTANRTNAVLPAVTTTVANSKLVYICGFRGPSNTATPATGYTELLDTNSINAPNCEVADMTQVGTTTTSAGTITKVTSSRDVVYHMAISPA